MEILIIYFIIFLVMEFLEANWQRADTLSQIILKNYLIYRYSGMLKYMSLNLSFFFVLYLAFALNNFSFWMSFIIVLKFIDISLKLYIFGKMVSEGEDVLVNFFPQDVSMKGGVVYINILTYGSCLFMALFG